MSAFWTGGEVVERVERPPTQWNRKFASGKMGLKRAAKVPKGEHFNALCATMRQIPAVDPEAFAKLRAENKIRSACEANARTRAERAAALRRFYQSPGGIAIRAKRRAEGLERRAAKRTAELERRAYLKRPLRHTASGEVRP